MQILISLSSNIWYRGLTSVFSKSVQDKSHITWVTSDKEYAKLYATDVMLQYNLKTGNNFKFGFRTLETEVKFEEVKSRVLRGITQAFSKKLVGKEIAYKLFEDIDNIDLIGYKRVWEWYMKEPRLAQALLKCGYDFIEAVEGDNNDVPTLGILNKSMILTYSNIDI